MALTTEPSGPPARQRVPTRRIVLRAAFTVGMVAGTAAVLAPVVEGDPAPGPASGAGAAPGAERVSQDGTMTGARPEPADRPRPERFAEMYRGREIRGTSTAELPADTPAAPVHAGHPVVALKDIEVHVDGRPLHIMRRADGTYLSHINHYESFPTLVETARAAVDELGRAQLPLPSTHSM
ncbi:tyrosinase family oxidase copper chaperone [Streptomyces sp. BE147]|uniref:tyrosinase family oxidase copper chaperone n=1 Tax=unclassified Streptomyces TaxID=2593676 RepID=UPI002E7969AC|nr:tyrosinase family oxidase copper chaperone [Streptomyces sp. BE147]MEE1742557.1 tyrosinase family oxidase copper chaperone [Streptomyces sp. BE147]